MKKQHLIALLILVLRPLAASGAEPRLWAVVVCDTCGQGIGTMVARDGEHILTVLRQGFQNAGQPNRLVDMAFAERAAGVGPVTMHGYPETDVGGSNRGPKAARAKERQGLPEAVRRGNRMRP